LLPFLEGQFTIYIKTLSGKTITLVVEDTDTVASVKGAIQERESKKILF